MNPTGGDIGFFECVDPDIGDLLPRHGDPDLDPDLRRQIENHLTICDSCRLDHGLEKVVVAGLELGEVNVGLGEQHGSAPSGRQRVVVARFMGCNGSLTAAVAVVLMLLLPPVGPGNELVDRTDGDSPRILRPVESEVVLGGSPSLSWTEIPGAVNYRITVQEVSGSYSWTDSTISTSIKLPDVMPAPVGTRLHAFISPVPADLVPPFGMSTSFRTGRFGSFIRYRLAAAPVWIRLMGLIGIGSVICALPFRLTPRRP